MEGSIRLDEPQRKVLLSIYRAGQDVHAARRAHVILLLADGWSYRDVRLAAYCSFDFIHECVLRFRKGGVEELSRPARVTSAALPLWLVRVARWLLTKTPRDFGFFRSRWSCSTLAEVLAWSTGERKSAETIRRGLKTLGYVWRRPRPVVGLTDPDYGPKLKRIQRLLEDLPPTETAVFQDEVDVHLNPKIGSCWMVRGQQSEVSTPGNNQKRHIAGSLHWRTGLLVVSEPKARRNTQMFLEHLDDLRRRLRGYRRIHVICDNAAFHASCSVREYLRRFGERIALHFLPKYAPETNPIERIWWRLHETITRNHRCRDLGELLTEVYGWLNHQRSFHTETLANYPRNA